MSLIFSTGVLAAGLGLAEWVLQPTNCYPIIGKYEEKVMWQRMFEETHGVYPWRLRNMRSLNPHASH